MQQRRSTFQKLHVFVFIIHISACRDYMGMENGDIPNENVQASSKISPNEAWKARLNGLSYWLASLRHPYPWIQADIGYQTYITSVVTQGMNSAYSTKLKISTFYNSINDDEIFISDESSHVKVSLIHELNFGLCIKGCI